MILRTFAVLVILLAGVAAGWQILQHQPPVAAEAADDQPEKGPHGGRLLRNGDFAVEITIYETGVPPEFHVYAYKAGKPVAPGEVMLTIELARLGGRVDRFSFKPRADYLLGSGRVLEPHSFDFRVVAEHAGQRHEWAFDSYEGRAQIPAEAAEAAEISAEDAGPAVIRETIDLTGAIAIIPDRTARVRARFPGVVRDLTKGLGDRVRAGEDLVVVEGNESFRTYKVPAPIGGFVLSRPANLGELATPDTTLYEIADLSTVWAELHVFARDQRRLSPGQPVKIVGLDGEPSASGALAGFAPLASAASQTLTVRVSLPNADLRWRPGMFVRGSVLVAERNVPLAVKSKALQRFRDFTVVFAQVGDIYEVRMLELGATDGKWTEVLGGLDPGERYVTENSFLIKADIEKSGASHDH